MAKPLRPRPRGRRPTFIDRVPLGRRLIMLAAMLGWIGFLLYPDPRVLLDSLRRLIQPPVNASAVAEIAPGLPNDALAIEAYSQSQVRYESAWKLYGVPWYFPTVDEVLRDKAGDCQAEAVLTASIFQAKGLPYTFRYSFDHVWVDYPGKQVTSLLEDPSTAFISDEGKGWFASLPDRIPIRAIVRERVSYHWDPMPPDRKAGLLAGMVLLLLVGERLIGPLVRPVARFRAQAQEG